MRKLKWATALFVITVIGVTAQELKIDARNDASIDREHAQWIDRVIRSISTIKPSMTRRDLARVFVEEGGLSTRSHRKYVYKQCSYIKVDVDFAPGENQANESPDDKIVKISKPYLEYAIAD